MPALKVKDRVAEGRRIGEVVALRPQNMVDVVFSDLDYPIRRPAGALTVLQQNPNPKPPVFIAAVLTPEAKRALYRWWLTQPLAPDPLPITKASHMTIQFRPSPADVASMPIGAEVKLKVTGWAADKNIQAVSVEPQGVGSANAVPHVTFAVGGASVAPKLANDLFVTPGVKKKKAVGPVLTARVGWSDGVTYHFTPPEGVRSNPGPRGGLTALEREQLEGSSFALPGRRWPINDRRHAVIALQYMLRGFGNVADYSTILRAIAKRYPPADKRNEEIWSFYAKHFDKKLPMAANPAVEVYDPAKEQFRAVVQGVYESQVRKALDLPYDAPFVDAKGRRLDAPLNEDTKRRLLSGAYAIATRQGQKHGWLVPGTQTPTEKGRARAFDRLAADQSEHSAKNRQDYERTLGTVRKSGYYRIVSEEVTVGAGRRALQYKVQPTPPAEAGVPAYRLSQRAAEQDVEKAERFRSAAPAQARVRMNPNRSSRNKPKNSAAEGELEYRRRMDEFVELSPEEARALFHTNVTNYVDMENQLRRGVASVGLDWEEDKAYPRVAEAHRILKRNLAFLEAKHEARESDLGELRQYMDEALRSIEPAPPAEDLQKERKYFATLTKAKNKLLSAAVQKWVEYRDMADIESVRSMTEGAKLGGIAGSGKNRASSEDNRRKFEAARKALNNARDDGDPELTEFVFALEHPYQAVKDFLDSTTSLEEREGGILLSDVPRELLVDVVKDEKGKAPKAYLPLPFMQQQLDVILESEGKQKTKEQENALDRLQEEREMKKLWAERLGFDVQAPFWDVERTVLIYLPKKDEEGNVVLSAAGYPLKQYVNYTMQPKQTLEQVFGETGFKPFGVPSGREGELAVERPVVRVRYVLYIPRVRRAIVRKVQTGISQTLSSADIQNLKGVRAPKGLGLRLEQTPDQTKRPKRRTPLHQDRGIVDPDVLSVYPSMILAKYFVVVDESGLGASMETSENDLLASAAFNAKLSTEMADALGTVSALTAGGVPIEELMLQRVREKAMAARLPGKGTQTVGRPFLSPENNWVKYNKLTNSFRRLRQGTWDENAKDGRGGYAGGVDIPQYDVFYTFSAPLAYLTFKYFNTPDALPHVEAKMEDVENVLRVLAPKRVLKSGRVDEEYEQIEPVRVGAFAVIGLGPKDAAVLQRPSERPVRSREETLGSLSVSPEEFRITPLNLLMVGDWETAQEAERNNAAQRSKLSVTLEVMERAQREGVRVGESQGRQIVALPSPTSSAPVAGAVKAHVGDANFDASDLVDNPHPHRPSFSRPLRKRY